MTTLADMRRRVMDWRAAEQRERLERVREGPLDPAAALDAALELHELITIDFRVPDAIRERDAAAVRDAWNRSPGSSGGWAWTCRTAEL